MALRVAPRLSNKFPGLTARIVRLRGLLVRREDPELERFRAEVSARARGRWTSEQLRENPLSRAYRDFFWRLGVDPTKTRPAAEALIRRILHGNPLPKVNTLVDAYNLASVETGVALAAFDEDRLAGALLMREAEAGEEFLGIGMEAPLTLSGGEVVVEDGERLVALYPYRDAEASKVTEATVNTLILVCGVPRIDEETLARAARTAVEYVTRYCGGSEV